MPNVIYNVGGMEEWIEVAKELEEKYDWKPKYWMSSAEISPEIRRNSFPDCVYHNRRKASKSISPENYSNSFQYPLEKEDLVDYVFEMSMSIKGMDRMDPDAGGAFEYDERLRNHFRLVMWWRNVIEDENIDKAVFIRPPHTPDQYTLYVACKQTDTDTIMLKDPIPLTNIIYSQDDIGETPIQKEDILGITEELPPTIEEDINRIMERESSQLTKGEIRKKRRKNYSQQIKTLLGCFLINPKKFNKTYDRRIKKEEKDIENSEYNYFEEKLRSIKEEIKKIKLHYIHNKISTEPDYSEKYIYFPLQYQPELTTNPKAGIFVHQFLVANLISCSLPEDMKLIVKEHPVTLFDRRPFGRNTYHYRHLKKLDNVEFANIESDQMKLIDNAEAVATMTGTPGWEGILRGTPALVFGNAWYRQCEGAYHIENKEDIKEALDEIGEEKYSIGENEARELLSRLLASSSSGYLDRDHKNESELNRKTAVQGIVNEIEKKIDS